MMLEHPEGCVIIEDLGSGRKRVAVELADPSAYMPDRVAETDYSLELIEAILALRGPAMLGYSIRRAEDPTQLAVQLRHYVLAYVDEVELERKRVLDFGCGSGSSTVVLAQLFPQTELVAIDLDDGNIAVARLRAKHHAVQNVNFLVSDDPFEVPSQIGTFDFICLSAVYEHLQPAERPVLMAKLWRALRPGGVLFLNQMPHRYYPVEFHTTGLPFLNFVSARLAFFAARHLSRRVDPNSSWEDLLRGGIRGGTEGEILSHLRAAGNGRPVLLQPSRLGLRDQVDLWYSLSMARRPLRLKRVMRAGFRLTSRVTGSTYVPSLELAIRKA
jgi:2-polyprenyl-3-methyl-5-hydroxy-6-metoxy-1,4-benzoquinol methylase